MSCFSFDDLRSRPIPRDTRPEFYVCANCDLFHPVGFGECVYEERKGLTDADLDAKHGINGWVELDIDDNGDFIR